MGTVHIGSCAALLGRNRAGRAERPEQGGGDAKLLKMVVLSRHGDPLAHAIFRNA